MPRIKSKSIIFISIKSIKMTLWIIVIGHFQYNHLETIDSPIRVEIKKGSERLLKFTPKFTTTSGVTNKGLTLNVIRHKHQVERHEAYR